MEKVEIIQYEAELAFTGAWQGSSCVKLWDGSHISTTRYI